MTPTADLIKRRLEALHPTALHLVDDSAAHAGHAGARESGGGHFHLTIVSDAFQGKTLVARHRMVYTALADLMQQKIHALQIEAMTPDQF
ncbi:MAG: BolA family transcriptional regulator [Betaproteobacteria bacterium]|nr:BolA family transcriptional regulator [Betaproteobacteria bacterium]